MNDWAELSRVLETLSVSGGAEIREDGEWFAELAGLHCEVHTQGKNPLVHLWTGERNLTRRILRIREQSENRIVLEVQRFGRTRPGRLEFLRTDSRRGAHQPREGPPMAASLSCGAVSRCDRRIAHDRAGLRAFSFRPLCPRADAGRAAHVGGAGRFSW